MSNYRKHIDHLFREKLGNYRETPPPEVWDQLESRLDGLAPVTTGFPYKWIWHFAIISAIVILGVVVSREKMNNTNAVTKSATPAAITTNNGNATPEKGTTSQSPAVNNPVAVADSKNDAIASRNNQNQNSSQKQIFTSNTKNNNKNTTTKTPQNGNKNTPVNSGKTNNPVKTYAASASYNSQSPVTKPAPEEQQNENSQLTNASPNTTLSVVNKPEVPSGVVKTESAKPHTAIAVKNSNAKHKPIFPRLEAGVKMGYEGGFVSGAAGKFVVAPYLQYNLSRKFAVMAQPAFKSATVPVRQIGTNENYYATEGGTTTLVGVDDQSRTIGTERFPKYVSTYTYTESHDSIVKSNKIGGSSLQAELPILLKYSLTKQISFYGGVNLQYNKLTGITENTYTASGITRSYNDTITTTVYPTGIPAMQGYAYSGTDVKNYKGPLVPAQSGSQFSVGYMVGFTYALNKKWLFDALIEQNPAKADYKGGYNINTPLSTPYFRLSIGYKLTK